MRHATHLRGSIKDQLPVLRLGHCGIGSSAAYIISPIEKTITLHQVFIQCSRRHSAVDSASPSGLEALTERPVQGQQSRQAMPKALSQTKQGPPSPRRRRRGRSAAPDLQRQGPPTGSALVNRLGPNSNSRTISRAHRSPT
jgi:hypothetical protein